MTRRISRRNFLKAAGVVGGSALLTFWLSKGVNEKSTGPSPNRASVVQTSREAQGLEKLLTLEKEAQDTGVIIKSAWQYLENQDVYLMSRYQGADTSGRLMIWPSDSLTDYGSIRSARTILSRKSPELKKREVESVRVFPDVLEGYSLDDRIHNLVALERRYMNRDNPNNEFLSHDYEIVSCTYDGKEVKVRDEFVFKARDKEEEITPSHLEIVGIGYNPQTQQLEMYLAAEQGILNESDSIVCYGFPLGKGPYTREDLTEEHVRSLEDVGKYSALGRKPIKNIDVLVKGRGDFSGLGKLILGKLREGEK